MDLDKLTASIQAHEGCKLSLYTDSTGHLTIGWGRDIQDVGISQSEADFMLGNDIQSCILQAQGEPWWPVVANDDVRSRAMLEILFNVGLTKLRGFVHALAYLSQGDFTDAAAEFMDSEWSREVGQRAVILSQMIATGNDPD